MYLLSVVLIQKASFHQSYSGTFHTRVRAHLTMSRSVSATICLMNHFYGHKKFMERYQHGKMLSFLTNVPLMALSMTEYLMKWCRETRPMF